MTAMIDIPYKSVDICISTYKRVDLLEKCLKSIAYCLIPDGIIATIIIVDNDKDQSAKEFVSQYIKNSAISVKYDVEPTKNISLARNKSIELGEAEVIFFIDDDEQADINWIIAHLNNLATSSASVSTGPVFPIYNNLGNNWIQTSKIFEPKQHENGAPLRTAATNNTAVLRKEINQARFDPQYGLTGGGDNEFFYRLHLSGKRISWCRESKVFESIPINREKVTWICRRGFRIGQSHTRIYYFNTNVVNKIIYILITTLQLSISITRVIFGILYGTGYVLFHTKQVAVRIGRISAFFNKYYVEYK